MTSARWRNFKRLVLVAAGAALLTGCGSSSERVVRIATFSGVNEVFDIHLAQSLGYFGKEGVAVSLEEVGSGTKLVQDLVGGSADAVFGACMSPIQMAIVGKQLQSVYVSSTMGTSLLVTSQATAGRIRGIEDLKGATVGIPGFGAPMQQALLYVMSQKGVRSQDVTFIPFGVGASAIAALEHSKVDAGTIGGATFEVLRRRAPAIRVLYDTRTSKGLMAAYGIDAMATFCLYSSRDWISHNREKVGKLVRALQQTHAWIQARPVEEVVDRIPDRFRTENRETDLAVYRILIAGLSKDGKMPPGAPDNLYRILSASEKTGSIDLAGTWTNEFVDPR